MIQGIRHAWELITFQNINSSNETNTSRRNDNDNNDNNTTTRSWRNRSRSNHRNPPPRRHHRRRHRHGRISLHQACSPILVTTDPHNYSNKIVRQQPGAYEIQRSAGPTRHHRVRIPNGLQPGSEFTTMIGQREITVQYPPASSSRTRGGGRIRLLGGGSRIGAGTRRRRRRIIRVEVQGEPRTRQTLLKMGHLTSPSSSFSSFSIPTSKKTKKIDKKQKQSQAKITSSSSSPFIIVKPRIMKLIAMPKNDDDDDDDKAGKEQQKQQQPRIILYHSSKKMKNRNEDRKSAPPTTSTEAAANDMMSAIALDVDNNDNDDDDDETVKVMICLNVLIPTTDDDTMIDDDDDFVYVDIPEDVYGSRIRLQCPKNDDNDVGVIRPGQSYQCQFDAKNIIAVLNINNDNNNSNNNKADSNIMNNKTIIEQELLTFTNYNRQTTFEKGGGWLQAVRASDSKVQWIPYVSIIDDDENKSCDNNDDDFINDIIIEKDENGGNSSLSFVRNLTIEKGKDPRFPTGTISLIPATEAIIDCNFPISIIGNDDGGSNNNNNNNDISSMVNNDKENIIDNDDDEDYNTTIFMKTLVAMQNKPLEEKIKWIHQIVSSSSTTTVVDDDNSTMKLVIRREYLLQDSIRAVMSMGKEHLTNKNWRIEFVNEPGVDWGGVTREWFQLISSQLFFSTKKSKSTTGEINEEEEETTASPLWIGCPNNPMHLMIHPNSAVACHESSEFCHFDHLIYYRFMGRLIGRAIIDQQLLKGAHLVSYLYKFLLGTMITLKEDLLNDTDLYRSFVQLQSMDDEEIQNLCLDFTTTINNNNNNNVDNNNNNDNYYYEQVELIPDGSNISVTKDNLMDYYTKLLQYRILEQTKDQTLELVLGFMDVTSSSNMSSLELSSSSSMSLSSLLGLLFGNSSSSTSSSTKEFELMLCGLPKINIDDWKANTVYCGNFASSDGNQQQHQVVQWFWEIVTEEFDEEARSKLLQFVTGSSGISPKRTNGTNRNNSGGGAANSFSDKLLSEGDESINSTSDDDDANISNNINNNNSSSNDSMDCCFFLEGTNASTDSFPKAQTCFNRLNLPCYETKEKLLNKLKTAISLSLVGFGIN